MRNLVPLTKIILTFMTAVWALILVTPEALGVLILLELVVLLLANELIQNLKPVIVLAVFSAFLGIVEYLGGGTVGQCYLAAARMMAMTVLFIYLLTTVKMQDLTCAMVQQLKIPYEYAFMFTAGLRFIPDFIEENRMVEEAQACRGLSLKGSFLKQVKRYMSIVRPLMLRSLGRSETMALSLELRGFGGSKRTFMETVAPRTSDYFVMALIVLVTVFVLYIHMTMGM